MGNEERSDVCAFPSPHSLIPHSIRFAIAMKQIIAVVKPFLAEKVLESLKRAPLEAISVREVKGYGRQKNYLDRYAGSEYSLAFLPKVEIDLWVDDARYEETLRRIVEAARTGRMGDGKIFVLSAEQTQREISF